MFCLFGFSRFLRFCQRFLQCWRYARLKDANASTAYLFALLLPTKRPPLPALAGCTEKQRRSIELAEELGVVAFRVFAPPISHARARYYSTVVIGDGYRQTVATADDEYQPGVERMVRVEWGCCISCGCTLGKQGKACPHAGAILWQLLA